MVYLLSNDDKLRNIFVSFKNNAISYIEGYTSLSIKNERKKNFTNNKQKQRNGEAAVLALRVDAASAQPGRQRSPLPRAIA